MGVSRQTTNKYYSKLLRFFKFHQFQLRVLGMATYLSGDFLPLREIMNIRTDECAAWEIFWVHAHWLKNTVRHRLDCEFQNVTNSYWTMGIGTEQITICFMHTPKSINKKNFTYTTVHFSIRFPSSYASNLCIHFYRIYLIWNQISGGSMGGGMGYMAPLDEYF